jgi:hypothetical protein
MSQKFCALVELAHNRLEEVTKCGGDDIENEKTF